MTLSDHLRRLSDGPVDAIDAEHLRHSALLLEQMAGVVETAQWARNRLERIADDSWHGDGRDFKRSLDGVFLDFDHALDRAGSKVPKHLLRDNVGEGRMADLRKPSLSVWWQERLNEKMEAHYPDVTGYCELVDAWKRNGWNDGTTTLFGVYRDDDGVYRECRFPDYGETTSQIVYPRFQHVGWGDSKEHSTDD